MKNEKGYTVTIIATLLINRCRAEKKLSVTVVGNVKQITISVVLLLLFFLFKFTYISQTPVKTTKAIECTDRKNGKIMSAQ